MKRNLKSLIFVMVITVTLIFSISLTGCSFGPFDIDFGFDDGAKLGGECFAFAVTATINEEVLLGYGVEICPGDDDASAEMSIHFLASSAAENEDRSLEYVSIRAYSTEIEENSSFAIRHGVMDKDLTFDETVFGYFEGEYYHEDHQDISVLESYALNILHFFSIVEDN